MRIKKASLALVAASALVLSACSSADDADNNGDGTNGTATTTDGNGDGDGDGGSELPGSDYNKVDPAELTQGGNVTFGIGQAPVNWNGMQVDGNTVDTNDILGFMSPINWIFDEAGAWEPNPNFVESYDVAYSDEAEAGEATEEETTEGEGSEEPAMTVTLKLNPEAKWNDGTPITVADYQATWDACNDPNGEFQCASTDGWTAIDSVEQGADEFEVVANFNIAYPDWSANLSSVQHAGGMSDPETFNTGWVNADDVHGWLTGPYKIENASERTITLSPNENWWGDQPKLDTVTFSVLEPEAMAQAFANSEIDVIDMIVDAPTYELVQNRQDGVVKMSSSVQWRHFTFNSRADNISDVEVRRAIQKGVDTADIAASDLAGMPYSDIDVKLGNHFFMPNQEGYEDHSVEYDPEGAMADLEALGYEMNDSTGYYEKDGETLGFTYLRITANPASENEGAMLQDQMEQIGVEVKFQDTPSADFFGYVIGGEYEVTSFAWNGTPYPMANVGQIYGKPFNDEGALVNSNFAGLEVPEIDEYVTRIAGETDHEERVKLTNEVDQIIWDNVMVLPIYYRATLTAVPENLANFGATAFETFLPEHIGYTE